MSFKYLTLKCPQRPKPRKIAPLSVARFASSSPKSHKPQGDRPAQVPATLCQLGCHASTCNVHLQWRLQCCGAWWWHPGPDLSTTSVPPPSLFYHLHHLEWKLRLLHLRCRAQTHLGHPLMGPHEGGSWRKTQCGDWLYNLARGQAGILSHVAAAQSCARFWATDSCPGLHHTPKVQLFQLDPHAIQGALLLVQIYSCRSLESFQCCPPSAHSPSQHQNKTHISQQSAEILQPYPAARRAVRIGKMCFLQNSDGIQIWQHNPTPTKKKHKNLNRIPNHSPLYIDLWHTSGKKMKMTMIWEMSKPSQLLLFLLLIYEIWLHSQARICSLIDALSSHISSHWFQLELGSRVWIVCLRIPNHRTTRKNNSWKTLKNH